MAFKTGKIKPRDVDLDKVAFAVDTALSWDGHFPKIGKGDFIVTIESAGEENTVLVSRRYTRAVDAKQAAEIALDAYGERYGYRTEENSDDTIRVASVNAVS